jgi:arylsulfatase
MLELAGVEAPETYRGIEQIPLHGQSLGYTFAQPDAVSKHITQYFEMGGQRGIYHDGWKAVTNHRSGDDYEDDRWELYDLSRDYSETVDLTSGEPERLKSMVDLWWKEAERYGVLPLDDRAQARAFARDPETDTRRHFTLLPGTRLLTPVTGPNYAMRSFRITAYATREHAGDEGVLLAYGRRAAGFSLFVQDNRLWCDYNLAGRHSIVSSQSELPTGSHELGCTLVMGDTVEIRLTLDGRVIGSEQVPMAFPAGFGLLSTQCGLNSPSPVSARYEAPFRFTGDLDRVEVELGEANEKAAEGLWEAAMMRQ